MKEARRVSNYVMIKTGALSFEFLNLLLDTFDTSTRHLHFIIPDIRIW